MAAYSYKTYIGHDYCVNFADAHENKAVQQVNIVYPFGYWLNDKTMREFGAYLGRTKQVLTQPAKLYDKSGNFPTLGRELFFCEIFAISSQKSLRSHSLRMRGYLTYRL